MNKTEELLRAEIGELQAEIRELKRENTELRLTVALDRGSHHEYD